MERYLRQNPTVSIQSKINMLNDRLRNKIKEEFLGKGIKYTDPEKKPSSKPTAGITAPMSGKSQSMNFIMTFW